MKNGRYIAIEGPIGVGKTSLANLLCDHYNGSLALEEPDDNPFLPDFYRDAERWALETQLTFLLSRHRQQSKILQSDLFHQTIIGDYIMEKDEIFARLNLNERELNLYYTIAKNLIKSAPVPDVVVYLKATPQRLMTNIKIRDIAYELYIEQSYLEDLCSSYNRFFRNWKSAPILAVNTNELDLIKNPDHLKVLIEYIDLLKEGKLKGLVEVSLD